MITSPALTGLSAALETVYTATAWGAAAVAAIVAVFAGARTDWGPRARRARPAPIPTTMLHQMRSLW